MLKKIIIQVVSQSSSCRILLSAELVASLSSLCPRLQSLRLGGLLDSARSVGKALEKQLPSLATAEVSSGLDSWEEADVDMDESQVDVIELLNGLA